MDEIIVRVYTSDQAERTVVSLLKNCGFSAKRATVNYNPNFGLPSVESIDRYPLILEGTMNRYPTRIFVYSVTAGYCGSGPHALVNILREAGFVFDEDDIFTKERADYLGGIRLKYTR